MCQVWWLSTNKMTVRVVVDEQHIITDAAPIVRKFVGQPASNLKRWLEKQGGYQSCRIG